MADVNANIGVNIDASDALAQLKQLQRQISQFHSSIQKSSEAAALAQRNLTKNFMNSVNAINGFSAELRTVRTTAESFTNSLEKNKFGLGEYFRYAGASTKTFGKLFTNEFNTIEKVATERVKTLQTQYIKLGRDASGAMQSIAIRPTVLDMQDLGTQAQIAAQKQALFNQLVKQGSTNLLNFGKNTQWAGRQLMVGFTLPLATLGTIATKTFMEMEAQVIKFRKVYGDLFTPTAERDKALEEIQALASAFTKYGVAASETVGLAAEAAAAGLSGVDLQRQVTQATRLSVLGQVDSQKALETTISLQNAFQISTEDLAESINFLNAVENQTVVSLDDVTTAIPKVAPIIRQLGGDVKDMAFFMAAMKEGGINASEGANALKSGLASLINPTDKAADMLGDLGINIRAIVERNQGDLSGLMTDFARALDQLDPLNRARAIEQLFGKFQFARVSTLFENIIRDGNQASRVLDLSSSSVQELAALAEQELGMTAESAMNKFTSAVEQLRIALVPIGEVFLNVVTPVIETIAEITAKFNKLPDGIKSAITVLVTLIGGLGPIILMTFGLLANAFANSIKFVAMLRNGYLRLTGQSQILGNSTEYLTQEQLEAAAVAASLDQAHSKLTQRFTAEAVAVEALRQAYLKALAAGNKFAAMNPGMMRPGSPKKFSTGGFVGGSGSGDTVPAMLTPGEFVVKKAAAMKVLPLLEAINNGDIQGFNGGGTVRRGSGKEGAVGKSQFTVPMIGGSNFGGALNAGAFLGINAGDKMSVLFAYAEQIMQESNVSLEGMKNEINKWRLENKKLIDKSVAAYKRGVPLAEAFADVNEKFVKDMREAQGPTSQFLDTAERLYPEMKKDLIEAQKAVRKHKIDLTTAAGTDKLKELLPDNIAAGLMATPTGMPRGQGGRSYQQLAKARGAIVSAFGGAGSFEQTGVPNTLLAAQGQYEKALASIALTQEHMNRTAQAEANLIKLKQQRENTNGPKERAAIDKEVKAAEQDLQTAKKKERAAKKAEDAAVKELQAATKKLETANSQSGRYRDPETGRFAKAPDSASGGAATEQVSRGFQGLNAKLMGATFAISSVAGAMSMFDGAIGDAAGKIFQLSSVMFGLITITELLAKTKLAEIATSRANAVGGLPVLLKGKGIAGLFTNLANGLKFVLRFLGPVGIGLSALAIGIPFLMNVINNQKAKVEGLGNAANFSAEELTNLANLLGQTNVRTTDFASGITRGGVGAAAQQSAQTLLNDENLEQFEKDYGDKIKAIKDATKEQAEQTLAALATQLSASGFETQAVQAIIFAIAKQAGQTGLDLKFASIDFTQDQSQIDKVAQSASQMLNNALAKNPIQQAVSQSSSLYGLGGTTQEIIPPDLQTQINAAAGQFASLFEATKLGFESGTLSADQMISKLNEIETNLMQIDPSILSKVMSELGTRLGLEEDLKNIKNVKDQLLIIKAVAAGVKVDEGMLAALANAGKSDRANTIALRTRNKLNKAIEEGTKLQEENNAAAEFQKEQEKVIMDANEAMADQITNLENQNTAYQILIDEGWSAADALDAVSNSTYAAALAAADGADERAQLIADLERIKELETSSPVAQARRSSGGGGGRKSDFQTAKESLIDQQREAQNTMVAYGKLRDAGLSVQDAFAAAEDPALAAAFATTKPGTAQWNELVGLLQQTREEAEALEKLELAVKVQTDFDGFFDDLHSKAMEYFDILERNVERKYRDRMDKEKKIIEAAEREISQLQRKIAEEERAIELDFTRPIEELQEESSDLSNDLAIIDQAAKKVNERYDAQVKALQEVKKINQDITNQQKTQISLADALSQGDISQAAQLMQNMRGQAAAASATSLESALGAARDSELAGLTGPGGMTRAEIEQRQFEISQQIYDLEEKREIKQRAVRDLQDQVYTIETGRLQNAKDRLDQLQREVDKQIEAIDKQRQKWDDAQLAQDLANIKAGKYNDVLRVGKLLVGDIVNRWNSIKDRIVNLYIREVRVPAGASIPSGGGGGGGSSSSSSSGSKLTPAQLQQAVRDLNSPSKSVRDRAAGLLKTQKKMYGGVIKKMANGGFVGGTGMGDRVPAMLTPGEFVVNKHATKRFMPMLRTLNGSKFPSMLGSRNFQEPRYNNMQVTSPMTSMSTMQASSSVDNSAVYNYNLSVSVNGGRDMDANKLANVVMTRIKQMDGHRIRRQSV